MRSDSIKKAKDGVSGGVFYLGLAVIGVLAIPAAVLLGLIAGVWTLTDRLTALLSESIDVPRNSGILAAGGMNMTDCTSCGGCAGGCGGCRSHVLLLTEPELRLLRQFAELAFLPAACTRTDETPVYLDGSENRAQTSAAILALQIKRLISVDFALPLKGFDYTGYEAWPIRGSMALTAAGRGGARPQDRIPACGEERRSPEV